MITQQESVTCRYRSRLLDKEGQDGPGKFRKRTGTSQRNRKLHLKETGDDLLASKKNEASGGVGRGLTRSRKHGDMEIALSSRTRL